MDIKETAVILKLALKNVNWTHLEDMVFTDIDAVTPPKKAWMNSKRPADKIRNTNKIVNVFLRIN